MELEKRRTAVAVKAVVWNRSMYFLRGYDRVMNHCRRALVTFNAVVAHIFHYVVSYVAITNNKGRG